MFNEGEHDAHCRKLVHLFVWFSALCSAARYKKNSFQTHILFLEKMFNLWLKTPHRSDSGLRLFNMDWARDTEQFLSERRLPEILPR